MAEWPIGYVEYMHDCVNMWTYLFLGELLAASLLADLMALVVAAGGAFAAVILALAADAFAAALPLLFRLQNRGGRREGVVGGVVVVGIGLVLLVLVLVIGHGGWVFLLFAAFASYRRDAPLS